MDKEIFKKSFFELVDNSENILITSHISPDDDSVSSVLSIQHLIKQNYKDKNIVIAYSSAKKDNWLNIPEYAEIKFLRDISEIINDFDLVICLDGGEYKRFIRDVESFKNFKGKTICIDHHSSPPSDFDLILINVKEPSNASNIYNIFFDDNNLPDKKMAEFLMLGILGDTGMFRFISYKNVHVLNIASKLISIAEMDLQTFIKDFWTYDVSIFDLQKELMKNTQFKTIKNWPPFQYSYIPLEFVQNQDIKRSNVSEGVNLYTANILKMVKGYEWGFCIYSGENDEFKISLRATTGSVNVRKLVEDLKIGGGHDKAAGGTFPGEFTTAHAALEYLFKWMEENKPEFNS